MTAVLDLIKGFLFWIPRHIDATLRGHYTGGAQAERDRGNLESLAHTMAEALAQSARIGHGYFDEDKFRTEGYRQLLLVAEIGVRLNDRALADCLTTFRREISPYLDLAMLDVGDPTRAALRLAFEAAMQRVAEMQADLR